MANKAVWMMLGGAGAILGSRLLPDPKQRLIVGGAGFLLLVWGAIDGLDDIMDFFGIAPKLKEGITGIETTDIDVERGSEGATGVISAFIIAPYSGEAVDKNSGTYPVKLRLASSRKVPTDVSVQLISEEFYSFGSHSEGLTKEFGTVRIGPGEQKDLTANVRFEASGPTNPLSPPQVSLTLQLNGAPRDVVRFSYE